VHVAGLCRRRTAAATAVAVGLGAGVVVLCAPAAASPDDEQLIEPAAPPAATGLIPSLAGIGTVLAQSGTAPTGPLGLPDLSAYAPALVLAQNPLPLPPGDPAVPALPSLSAFNPEYLIGQNTVPAAPGEGIPAAGIGPSAEDPGTGRLAFLRRLHEMYEAGLLDGALLGQQSPDPIDAPLP
jgi:hypothetical protein